jgi:tetratricopeptide (TPR) repeat protein
MSTVLGDFYMAGDMEKVLAYVERLTIWFPESSIVHGWAGQVHMMMEQPETAIAYYEEALTLNPENEEAKAALEQLK